MYTSNRVHIIKIQSAASSFMGIWTIRSPLKIHCYTCMSFETCWSRLIYTKLSSHRSFVINMYVITMAWRCISPWSFHRSLQRRREMDIFHICQQFSTFWSKKILKIKKRKAGLKIFIPKMYESYRDLFLIVILCHNWYMSLVKRLIFTQCMYGMWIDNLSKTSQKKKLGNVCTMYYVDFFFCYWETQKLLSCFPMEKYNFERHISVF